MVLPSVLVIAPGTPASLEGKSLLGEGFSLQVCAEPARALADAGSRAFDLLVLVGLPVDEQQRIVLELQRDRHWRLVPVLYVIPPATVGVAVPGCYRPEMDGLVHGALGSPLVERRIRAMAREGTATAELVVAGPFEFDPVRSRLRLRNHEVTLTEREAEIVAILLGHANRTVSAEELIGRGWGATADDRHVQILRRHVSNIRRKLEETPARRSLRTVRSSGYRFDTRVAG